jgi:hypothetical protein
MDYQVAKHRKRKARAMLDTGESWSDFARCVGNPIHSCVSARYQQADDELSYRRFICAQESSVTDVGNRPRLAYL